MELIETYYDRTSANHHMLLCKEYNYYTIFENDTITGTYTISIDPVDMMLASENPYNWQSCYRLETPNEASHADGCLAAILDSSSLITYIWDKEGKFNLYNHDLKCIRYKRIREWIAI